MSTARTALAYTWDLTAQCQFAMMMALLTMAATQETFKTHTTRSFTWTVRIVP